VKIETKARDIAKAVQRVTLIAENPRDTLVLTEFFRSILKVGAYATIGWGALDGAWTRPPVKSASRAARARRAKRKGAK